jgi:A/G-specific adenine glycosylase
VASASGRTGELPARKPKKTIPKKSTVMLVVAHQGAILLEQRPPSGIWGGLLSLPELQRLLPSVPATISKKLLSAALAEFGEVASFDSLPAFTHSFTHYKLQVNPLSVSLSRSFASAAQSGYQWVPVKNLASTGLPAPVKKLLENL